MTLIESTMALNVISLVLNLGINKVENGIEIYSTICTICTILQLLIYLIYHGVIVMKLKKFK